MHTGDDIAVAMTDLGRSPLLRERSQPPSPHRSAWTDWVFERFLAVYLIGSMLFWWPNQMAYAPQEMFVQYSAFVFVLLSWIVPRRRVITSPWMAAVFGWAMLQTGLVAFDPVSRMALVNLFLGCVTIVLVAERIDLDHLGRFGRLFLGFLAWNYALLALQVINRDPIFQNVFMDNMPQVDQVGFMGAKFAMGCTAALILPLIFAFRPWWVVALLPAFWFSKSSTAVAAGFASLCVCLWPRYRRAFWVLVVLAVTVGGWYVIKIDAPTGQFSKRLDIWWAAVHLLRVKPWWGYGLGKWAQITVVTIQENGAPQQWVWAHNDWLQYVFEQGVIGGCLLFGYCRSRWNALCHTAGTTVIRALVLSLAMVAFVHFPAHVGRLAGIMLVILALVEAAVNDRRDDATIPDRV